MKTTHSAVLIRFLINIPIGIACLAITKTRVQESRDARPRRIDWAGQAMLTGSLFLLVLALLRGNEDGWASTLIVAELGTAFALMIALGSARRRPCVHRHRHVQPGRQCRRAGIGPAGAERARRGHQRRVPPGETG